MSSEQFIDLIYEAALLPDRWQAVLDRLTEVAGALGTMLHASHDARNGGICTKSVRHVVEDLVKPEWAGKNERGKLLFTLPQAQFHSDADHYSDAEMEKSWFYNEFIWPRGIGYAAATWIAVPNGDNLILSVEKPRKDGPFRRETVEMLTSLRPHLARSALLAARMDFEQIQTANHVFELIGMPAAALRPDGRIIDCNSLFSERPDQIALLAGNRVKILGSSADRILKECLSTAFWRGSRTELESRSLPLPSTDSSPAAVLHLIPVRRLARDVFSQAAFFMVVTSLGERDLPPTPIIQGLFDLTTAETRVAQCIALGQDVSQTGAELQISRETVRFHLKNIFSKTGFSKQADLATSVARIPPFK